jgi:phosphoglucosamine mutase
MTLETDRLFGTDGIRGRAGEGWLVPERVSALGRSAGRLLGRTQAPRALLGHDGRRSGPPLEAALARGLAAAGFGCTSAGLTTTPGLATMARLFGYELTAMLSASHNPAEDNGIKLFGPGGEKLGDDLERAIEADVRAPENQDLSWGSAPPLPLDQDLEEAYLGHLMSAAGNLKLDGLRIALDCANGGASRIGPRLFGRLGAQISPWACEPDGGNINQDCGATQPGALAEIVRREGADLGVALDGDGDRCILVDEMGSVVHGDGILTVLARHARDTGALADPRIVATVMSNRGLHRALRELGIGVLGVDVGDRRVVEALRREGLSLGGEQSGHIVFGADNAYIGDGLYTAVRVLQVLRATGRPLSELAAAYQPFPQVLVNVGVARKPPMRELSKVAALVAATEAALGEDGRVLLRYSGTEPLARVMVEGPDAAFIQARAQAIAEAIERDIGIGASAP